MHDDLNGSEAAVISQRIDALSGSRRYWLWIVLISIGGFFEIYDLALTGPLSTALVAAGIFRPGATGLFGLADQATFIFSTFAGLYLGVLVFAVVGDQVGRKAVFAYSLVWYATATLVLGLQNDVIAICFWRFVAGIGLGAEAVAIDCFLVELAPAKIRGRTFSISMAIQYLAIPVSALLAAVLVSNHPFGVAGWRWLNLLPVIGAIGFWVARRGLPDSPRWLASKGRIAEANIVIDKLGTTSTKTPTDPVVVAAPAFTIIASRGYVIKMTVMILIYFNLQNLAYYGFSNWVPTLLQSQGANLKGSLFYTAGIALAAPLAPLLISLISDRVERKHLIMFSGMASVVLGLLFAWSKSPPGWLAFGLMLALSNSILSVNSHNYMSEVFPTRVRARAVGFTYSFTRLTAAFSGYVIAYVLARGGVTTVFMMISGLMAVAVLTVALFGPRTRNASIEDAT